MEPNKNNRNALKPPIFRFSFISVDKTINELIVYRFVVSSFKIHLEREQDRLAMTRPAAALLIAIGVSTSILQRGESEISCAKKAIFKVSLNKGVF